eukprot:4302225-Alexandrium_andersonii.AAC.1
MTPPSTYDAAFSGSDRLPRWGVRPVRQETTPLARERPVEQVAAARLRIQAPSRGDTLVDLPPQRAVGRDEARTN